MDFMFLMTVDNKAIGFDCNAACNPQIVWHHLSLRNGT